MDLCEVEVTLVHVMTSRWARTSETLSKNKQQENNLSTMWSLATVVNTYNLTTWELETGGSRAQSHIWLRSKFEVGLDYMRFCLKK